MITCSGLCDHQTHGHT